MRLGPNQEAWLKALETTQAPQTHHQLRVDAAFCCLGIACVVLGIPDDSPYSCYGEFEGIKCEAPPSVSARLAFVRSSGSDFYRMNDTEKLKFPEIAAKIRAHPEQYFTEPK